MADRASEDEGLENLRYIINHLFLPLKLPQCNDQSASKVTALASQAYQCARSFSSVVKQEHQQAWKGITSMLHDLHQSCSMDHLSAKSVLQQLQSMRVGDSRMYLIRRQNAAVLIRREQSEVVVESYETSPSTEPVLDAVGKLICSFPGPAVTVPHPVCDDGKFLAELANFLQAMDMDEFLDAIPQITKAGSLVPERRDTTNPRYITELLTGILLGVGKPANVPRISKRIGDDVLWLHADLPWRRAPLWLAIRVAIQSTFARLPDGQATYKSFVLFLLASTLEGALRDHKSSFSDDNLFCMSAKISRRLWKLGAQAPPALAELTCKVAKATRGVLEARHSKLVPVPLPALKVTDEDLTRDSHLSLPNSRAYIDLALSQSEEVNAPAPFSPDHCTRRRRFASFVAWLPSQLYTLNDEDKPIVLVDFEQSVHHFADVEAWRAGIENADTAANQLTSCMKSYFNTANVRYKGDPEAMSVMYLTLLLLWVALDRIVLKQIPLLGDFRPELETKTFEPLLLRTERARNLLKVALAHITNRHSEATSDSVLQGDLGAESFPVRYFDNSTALQDLKQRIRNDAKAEKQKTLIELQQKTEEYRNLQRRALRSSHDDHEYFRNRRLPCSKCNLEEQMQRMSISIYEWPLPSDDDQAKSAVFEIACPLPFAAWRDATYFLMSDVLSPSGVSIKGGRWHGVLDPAHDSSYEPLCKYATNPLSVRRVTMGSTIKSFLQTHYQHGSLLLSTSPTADNVIVNNGLRFHLFETHGGEQTSHCFDHPDITNSCTYTVPQGFYSNLAYSLKGTTHSPNAVIARQSECDKGLSIHEYWAYGSLRSGAQTQWMNILRALRGRSLNFRQEEVYLLGVQAALQVGPHLRDDDQTSYPWHIILQDETFCLSLIGEANSLLEEIQDNWLEVFTTGLLVDVLLRMISSSKTQSVLHAAYATLRCARGIVFTWLEELCQAPDRLDSLETQSRIRDIAAVCLTTFDAETRHIASLLSPSHPEDLKIYVQSFIVLHDYTPGKLANLPGHSKRLLARVRRSAILLESYIFERVNANRAGLDQAIRAVWRGYRANVEQPWARLPTANSRWITCTTAPTAQQASQTIHYNLLSGSLLVDGQSLGRLPASITGHDMYSQLFAEQILEVVPSDLPGMKYATREIVEGYQVFFGLLGGEASSEPLIKAKHVDNDAILQLIPSPKFQGDLPLPLVQNHVHWLNLTTRTIELRPSSRKWAGLYASDWRIDYGPHSAPMMRQAASGSHFYLVDPLSPTCRALSTYLRPIELPSYQIVSCTMGSSPTLDAELARSGFLFSLNAQQELQSRELSDFVIDTNQSTGTMIGLQNQLVLAPRGKARSGGEMRRVIIPRGTISYEMSSGHTEVTIGNPEDVERVSYDIYKVETDLGRLKFSGSASLTSCLSKVYLHALTALSLPDQLTQRTGTEEALRELRSASCLSFSALGAEDDKLLQQIAELTPRRCYYPTNMKRMQSVYWRHLSPLSQHEGFLQAVSAIRAHASRMESLSDSPRPRDAKDTGSGDGHLLRRASFRRMAFQRDGFASINLDKGSADVLYLSIDRVLRDETIQKISSTSTMVSGWSFNVSAPLPTDLLESLKRISSGTSLAPQNPSLKCLSYSRTWLAPPHETWITAFELCRKGPNKFQLLFTLPSMAYCHHYENRQELLSALYCTAMLARNFPVSSIPTQSSHTLDDGTQLDRNRLQMLISRHYRPIFSTPEASWVRDGTETYKALKRRKERSYADKTSRLNTALLNAFASQWNRSESPGQPEGSFSTYILMDSLLPEVRKLFNSWQRNRRLREHANNVQNKLSQIQWDVLMNEPCSFTTAPRVRNPDAANGISYDALFSRRACQLSLPAVALPLRFSDEHQVTKAARDSSLRLLLTRLRRLYRGAPYETYVEGLETSRVALEKHVTSHWDPDEVELKLLAQEDLQLCQKHFTSSYRALIRASSPATSSEKALFYSGLWPSLSVTSLLGNLAMEKFSLLGDEWAASLENFARITIAFQTSRRRAFMIEHCQYQDLIRDLDHTKQGSYLKTCPDWLLVQIDADFTLRDVQYQVADQMISEGSDQSIALQLNMGEGKSSVIAPLVAAWVANGSKLARMIVLKPLAPQMAQTMHDRLTGLANRRLYHLPFSRATKLDTAILKDIEDILHECMAKGGVLIIQPEQILSLKLRTIECQMSTDLSLCESMTRIQTFLFQHARDMLDESDEILHVRYQLVYTAGDHQRLQGHPHRWTTTQEVLRLTRDHLRQLSTELPSAFSAQGLAGANEHEQAAFPRLRLLDSPPEAAEELLRRILDDIMCGRLSTCNMVHFHETERSVLLRFISKPKVSERDEEFLQDMRERGAADDIFWNSILLLRGLIGFGILTFALKDKRYRVDYGLDLRRSMLAVPYRAKDSPSPNAEFGHPDVAVLLTCLSYYFTGLSETQLEACVRFLGSLDNPQSVYQDWTSLIELSELPQSLRSFKGLNFESAEQRKVICRVFGHNQATIDFYLRTVVFPQEAKEFESRLACSAWDIVERKVNITTGFSGTNDFRHLLPTYIAQEDPDHQLSTNARVLSNMLREENDHYETFPFPNGLQFVEKLSKQTPRIRMLLDVGAQMLDVQNRDLVEHWLRQEREEDTIAAVYVNDKDELTVLYRDGHVEPLSRSHVNQHLGKCIIYLDDAHTRGIDVKLPAGFRAAVTLGPRVTKDRLAQGCMRMRRLGAGHTICFFAPPEIERGIRRVMKRGSNQISAKDVLLWAIAETCQELKTRALQWAHQGVDHHTRYDAWARFLDTEDLDPPSLDHLRAAWLQREARTLEEMYGIHANAPTDPLNEAANIPEIYHRCLQLGLTPSAEHEVRLDEEQEREVAHEIEREEQVERPPPKSAAEHRLHSDVVSFIKTGRLRSGSSAFVKAFSLFSGTPAEFPDGWTGKLWATRDFGITVVSDVAEKDFFRPIHWVLSNLSSAASEGGTIFVIPSSFEVNALLPRIMKSNKVHLHVFTPRLTQEIQPCDDLSLFSIPHLPPSIIVPLALRLQLILISGQLYLKSHEEYIDLCRFLGVVAEDIADQQIRASPDGFVQPSQRPEGVRDETPFAHTPIAALAELMNIRRKGMTFDQTHIGKIVNARPLSRQDFR
ncbi:hypothetical protein CONPUDRAFT_168597 [Coniophora puteana RWD-64-598 SS2]|uniref:ubiquitinyl hydrolase 1 n=1 Tax=Coniophora puteana (strain RWD-64-598) TaxID=741705 RepID=A0A5M3MCB6_CONPW|nr:uncharacterized protein CONPUDRAFT_168597 [Coniophora puteana RWD-64-598 SS2]EIW76859.1 hypothetical protein CONPUDRAFT_168597 [Coniophora puteana RWD-64-598 SS2]